jgi:hypothetical protein
VTAYRSPVGRMVTLLRAKPKSGVVSKNSDQLLRLDSDPELFAVRKLMTSSAVECKRINYENASMMTCFVDKRLKRFTAVVPPN